MYYIIIILYIFDEIHVSIRSKYLILLTIRVIFDVSSMNFPSFPTLLPIEHLQTDPPKQHL